MKIRSTLSALLLVGACQGRDSAKSESGSSSATADLRSRDLTVANEDRPAAGPGAGGGGQMHAQPPDVDKVAIDGKFKTLGGAEQRQQAIENAKEAGVLGSTLEKKPEKLQAAKKPAAATPSTGAETATRSWFPETFLFEPLVVTDGDGSAVVPVRVPDRLTSWRVLALGHTRSGAQGGAVTSFMGTLPAYVDAVVPPFLVVGDEIKLPIQSVNTTDKAIQTRLSVSALNAALAPIDGARTIPADGSIVDYATVKATQAGFAKVRAAIEGTDAVERVVEIVPSGKPVVLTRSGTLAAPRKLTIEGPANADPTTDRVRLLVFPGALALLRSELGVSTARGGVAEDAYALLLAGKADALLATLGDKADPVALRDLAILTSQRAIRDARGLDVNKATLLAEAALAHTQNPVMARLGERAVAYLAQNQRPDGTFSGGDGWTLQRLLVATAEATRAVASSSGSLAEKQRAMAVAVKAAGAFERNFNDQVDGYTAAAILSTGAVEGELAVKLRKRVTDAIKATPDGARYLAVAENVVRPDGTAPNTAEATALAVLALTTESRTAAKGAPKLSADPKLLADLGATLLGSYNAITGWGDGHANLSCMRAVIDLFKTPVPANVKITLTMDGKPIVDGTLDRTKLRDVLTLDGLAPGIAGKHEWAITAEPAVAGLGYSIALRSWVPWEKETTHGGLELALPATVGAQVGRTTEIAVTAIAPAGMEVHIQQALPAGVQIDRPTLDALVASHTIARFESADGKLDLYVPPLAPGQTFSAKYKVIATLAGTLRSAASKIEANGITFHVPPTQWVVK